MNKDDLKNKIQDITNDLTNLLGSDTEKTMSEEKAAKFDTMTAELNDYKRQLSDIENKENKVIERGNVIKTLTNRTVNLDTNIETKTSNNIGEKIQRAFKENRALTLSTNGEKQYLDGLYTEAVQNDKLLKRINVQYTDKQGINVPFYTSLSGNFKQANESGGTAESQQTINFKNFLAKPYIAWGYISDEIMELGPANVLASVEAVLKNAFSADIIKELITGTGTGQLTGILNDNTVTKTVTAASTGAPVYKDYLRLLNFDGGKIQAKDKVMLMNGETLANLLDSEIKQGQLTFVGDSYYLAGCQIIECADMSVSSATTTANAICFNAKDLALLIVKQLKIQMLSRTTSSLLNPFQAIAYIDGGVITGANFGVLKCK